MTIRTKLTLSITLLLAVTMGLMSAGVLVVSESFASRDAEQRIGIIENSAQRAAKDALLLKDDLALISYFNFLRAQYPALSFARITWQSPEGRSRSLTVGEESNAPNIDSRWVLASDPGEAARRVRVRLGIDSSALSEQVRQERRRLGKIVLLVAIATILLGALFSVWFARTLTAPLNSLVKLAAEIGTGKLGGRLEWTSDDELGALVKVFNRMSQRLEELDETKKNFVSSVTHELRSPLGAIESFLHLVEERMKADTAQSRAQCDEYIGRIKVNIQRLSRFITDLLDVAKIERGKMECVLKPMRIQDTATEVVQFFEARAKEQGINLVNQLDPHLPQIFGDPERLRQVLINLVTNSLKFTPKAGTVWIGGEQYREGTSRWLEVQVGDTGRGMDHLDIDRMFQAFSQGRNVGDGVFGSKGTGLGLYIVKSIVEQHGGKIDIKSTPGKGTRLTFSVRVMN